MFNHLMDKAGQTSWAYFPEEKSFAVTAKEDIKAGDEAFSIYNRSGRSR